MTKSQSPARRAAAEVPGTGSSSGGLLEEVRRYLLTLPHAGSKQTGAGSIALQYLSAALVVLFVARRSMGLGARAARRSSTSSAARHTAAAVAGNAQYSNSAAALVARKKLRATSRADQGLVSWFWKVWVRMLAKVWQTIRM